MRARNDQPLIRTPLVRDTLAGAVAGLAAGAIYAATALLQSEMGGLSGLFGTAPTAAGLMVHLLLAAIIGASFGALFRYQAQGYAATFSAGVLYGLLWWILDVLTLAPLLAGGAPDWSLTQAAASFSGLIGHLLHGGLTAFLFHLLVAFSIRAGLALETAPREQERAGSHVVILGGGFGGVATAQRLEELHPYGSNVEITLVSQSNYLLFTPMLAEVASSSLEAQHISAPVRAALRRCRFVRGEVQSLDLATSIVMVRTHPNHPPVALPFEHLVLALGSVPNYLGLPGMQEHSFSLKTLADAILLRNHVINLLEHADHEPDPETRRAMLTFVVAGGGFAGTEMIAELYDLVGSVLRYYPGISSEEPRFALVHSRDRILPELGPELAEYSLRTLQRRGIEFVLGKRVSGATAEGVLIGGEELIRTRTLIWTAGNQPHPLLRALPCERNRAGAVVAESTLQLRGFPNVWALGDCAQVPDPLQEGQFYPPTAQHALRQGKTVADNISLALRGRPPKPFRFRALGALVALGHRTAAAEVMGLQFSGMLAWLMWRSIYLGKLPGMEKKVRVALDWVIDLFFPRDIVLTMDMESRGTSAAPVVEQRPRSEASTASMPTVAEETR